MSIFKKYEANLAEFKDFRRGSLRNLANVTNTQTNSGTKLMDAGLYCVNNTTQYTTVPDNTQFALGRDPFVFFASFKSIDDLGVHHIYSMYNAATNPRIIIRRYPAITTNFNLVDSNGVSVFSSGSFVQDGERVQMLVVVIPASNLAYVYKNGIFEHTINIATLTGNFNFATNSTIGVGVGRTANVNDLLYYAGLFKNTSMTGREVAQFYAEMEFYYDQNIRSKAEPDSAAAGEIYFKGEFAAIARENTITTGFIENTGAEILSGSFKVLTEKNSGKLEKIIECVSTGSFYLSFANASLTGWRRYVNSGAGYAAVITDLATARTIPMTTGQKLIWASEDELRSLYQMA